MPNPFKSTAYRVAIIYSAAFALAVILLSIGAYLALHRALLDQLDVRMDSGLADLTAEYETEGLAGLEEEVRERGRSDMSGGLGYALFDSEGRRIAGRLAIGKPPPGTTRLEFLDEHRQPHEARADVRSLDGGLTLVAAADQEPLEAIDRKAFSLLFLALSAVAGIGVGGGLILGGYLRRRLGRISTGAQAIMGGDLAKRMPISGKDDEFDRLSESLNGMLDRIVALLENLRQVSSDIAHDLRTPLMHLRNRLDKALAQEGDPRAMRATVEDALAKTDEILTLFAAILRISEIESRKPRRSFVRFDLSALVLDVCQSFAPAIEDNGRSLKWSVASGVPLEGDRELVAQALVNLLENAQKHTPPGTRIDVRLELAASRPRLTVADDGPGVAEQDLERITGRFIRLDGARDSSGHGLGLNMVAAIADLHDADLSLRDNHPGLAVTLTFAALSDARPTEPRRSPGTAAGLPLLAALLCAGCVHVPAASGSKRIPVAAIGAESSGPRPSHDRLDRPSS